MAIRSYKIKNGPSLLKLVMSLTDDNDDNFGWKEVTFTLDRDHTKCLGLSLQKNKARMRINGLVQSVNPDEWLFTGAVPSNVGYKECRAYFMGTYNARTRIGVIVIGEETDREFLRFCRREECIN